MDERVGATVSARPAVRQAKMIAWIEVALALFVILELAFKYQLLFRLSVKLGRISVPFEDLRPRTRRADRPAADLLRAFLRLAAARLRQRGDADRHGTRRHVCARPRVVRADLFDRAPLSQPNGDALRRARLFVLHAPHRARNGLSCRSDRRGPIPRGCLARAAATGQPNCWRGRRAGDGHRPADHHQGGHSSRRIRRAVSSLAADGRASGGPCSGNSLDLSRCSVRAPGCCFACIPLAFPPAIQPSRRNSVARPTRS